MRIPEFVQAIWHPLESAGHQAWCVGGCVRDMLLGHTPQDWDVTTDAKPEQVLVLFGDAAIPTGLAHGTVTVCMDEARIEVTTFRTDGAFLDHRHPAQVVFTPSLE